MADRNRMIALFDRLLPELKRDYDTDYLVKFDDCWVRFGLTVERHD
ncbi:MAG: hypothetical protein WCA08_13325 [Desulfoferrobacter sp.]